MAHGTHSQTRRFTDWRNLRRSRFLTRLLGPCYVTNVRRIEIDITFDCNLKCLNCDRSCRQAPSKARMSLAQIERFLSQSCEHSRQWDRVSILGGEPFLHPDLAEIVRLLDDNLRGGSGETEIVVVTNGMLPDRQRELSARFPGVTIRDTGKDTQVRTYFEPFNLAPVDLPEFTRLDHSNGCWITADCGMALNRHGYYPCAVAGGIDRVAGLCLGAESLPRRPEEMRSVLSRCCGLCGHFIRGRFVPKAKRAPVEGEPVSESWRDIYSRFAAGPPMLPLF